MTSPTVSLKAVLITSVIDAYEGREVAIFNVHRDFLMSNQDEIINTTLRRKLGEIMAKTPQKCTGSTS